MLGIVENMSYIVCPDCGKHINVFGESHVDEVAAKHGLPVLAKCPIDPQLAALSDAGMIETYGGEYLEGAADACEKLLKSKNRFSALCRLRGAGLFGCRKYGFLRLRNAAKWRKDVLFRISFVLPAL